MKMKIPAMTSRKCFLRAEPAAQEKRRAESSRSRPRAGISVTLKKTPRSHRINVIGRNVDEATSEVEKFIDRAFLAGLTRVRIVHAAAWHSPQGAAPVPAKTSARGHRRRTPAERRRGGATVVELRE